jgi:hypothetical protein
MDQYIILYNEAERLIEQSEGILAISNAKELALIVDSLHDGNGNLKLEKFTINENNDLITIVCCHDTKTFTFASSVSPIDEVSNELRILIRLLIIQKTFVMQFDRICGFNNDELYCKCISIIYAVAEAFHCNISSDLLEAAGDEYTTSGRIGKENVLYITILLHMITMTMNAVSEEKDPAIITNNATALRDSYGIADDFYMQLFQYVLREGLISDKINESLKEQVFHHIFHENKDVSMLLMVFQIYCRGL